MQTSATMAPSVTIGRQCIASTPWPGMSSGIDGVPLVEGEPALATVASPHSGQEGMPAGMRSRQIGQRTLPLTAPSTLTLLQLRRP